MIPQRTERISTVLAFFLYPLRGNFLHSLLLLFFFFFRREKGKKKETKKLSKKGREEIRKTRKNSLSFAFCFLLLILIKKGKIQEIQGFFSFGKKRGRGKLLLFFFFFFLYLRKEKGKRKKTLFKKNKALIVTVFCSYPSRARINKFASKRIGKIRQNK